MATNPARRKVRYETLDDLMADVDRLLANGYTKAGRWSLGQACSHMSKAMTQTVDGEPRKAPWYMRWVLGPIFKPIIFRQETMPEGLKIPFRSLEPTPEADDRAEVEALRAAIRHLQSQPGPLRPHPLFGPLSTDEWKRFHCIHAAHHMSFLKPIS